MKSINKKDKNRLLYKQRAMVFLYRMYYSFYKPWKFVFVLPILFIFPISWRCKGTHIPFFEQPILTTIYAHLIEVLIVLLSIISLVTVLKLLVTPFRARKYEDHLLKLGLVAYDGTPPALISCHRIPDTKLKKLTFYSLGIGQEVWQKRKAEIEDALNLHLVDIIRYGGKNECNRNIIVLTCGNGTNTGRKEVLFDDEF